MIIMIVQLLLLVIQRLHQGVHPQQSTPSPYATLWTTSKLCKIYSLRTNFSPSNFTKVDFLLRQIINKLHVIICWGLVLIIVFYVLIQPPGFAMDPMNPYSSHYDQRPREYMMTSQEFNMASISRSRADKRSVS